MTIFFKINKRHNNTHNEGESIIDTYPNTSSYELKKVGYGDVVHSGDINMEGIIKVKIRGKYERGNLAHILNIASHAPGKT